MKSAGENVKKGEPIVELETDKVTQELYAENSGVLKEILFNEQEEVKIGETIGVIDLIEYETEGSIGSDIVNTNESKKDIKEETKNEKEGGLIIKKSPSSKEIFLKPKKTIG